MTCAATVRRTVRSAEQQTHHTPDTEQEHAQAATAIAMSDAGEATTTEVPTAAEETATPQATGTPSVGEGKHGSNG